MGVVSRVGGVVRGGVSRDEGGVSRDEGGVSKEGGLG